MERPANELKDESVVPSLTSIMMKSLKEREDNGTLRSLVMENEKVNGKLVDFASNDYFGFAKDDELYEAVKKAYEDYRSSENRTGSTGSRLLTGDSSLAREFESYLTTFHKGSVSLLFNSGFDANLSVFSCVPQTNTVVLYDELIHNSVREGLRLCRGESERFNHNDVKDLKIKMEKYRGKKNIIVSVESVYSMDGDVSPLLEICELAKLFKAEVIVDEAHGVGVLGERGTGLCQFLGVENDVFIRVYTFGKALGCHGAVVVCRDAFMKSE